MFRQCLKTQCTKNIKITLILRDFGWSGLQQYEWPVFEIIVLLIYSNYCRCECRKRIIWFEYLCWKSCHLQSSFRGKTKYKSNSSNMVRFHTQMVTFEYCNGMFDLFSIYWYRDETRVMTSFNLFIVLVSRLRTEFLREVV